MVNLRIVAVVSWLWGWSGVAGDTAETWSLLPGVPPPPTLPPWPALPTLPTFAPIEFHNCDKDYVTWISSWSDEKKAYCCKWLMRGCMPSTSTLTTTMSTTGTTTTETTTTRTTTSVTTTTATTTSVTRTRTTTTKTTTSRTTTSKTTTSRTNTTTTATTSTETRTSTTETTTTATRTTTENPCQKACKLDGKEMTCTAAIRKTMMDYLGDPDACKLARDEVASQCRVCGHCAMQDAGCGILDLVTKAPTEYVGPPCDRLCDVFGQESSCRSRITWVSQNMFADRPDGCKQAHDRVNGDCGSVCLGCQLAAPECKDPVQTVEPKAAPRDVVGKTGKTLVAKDLVQASDAEDPARAISKAVSKKFDAQAPPLVQMAPHAAAVFATLVVFMAGAGTLALCRRGRGSSARSRRPLEVVASSRNSLVVPEYMNIEEPPISPRSPRAGFE